MRTTLNPIIPRSYIRLLRPNQWIKNLLIFIPLIFSGSLTNVTFLLEAALSLIFFSVLSSGVYVMNDVVDVERDRNHPLKKMRPLASGEVSKRAAVGITVLLVSLALIGLFLVNRQVGFAGVGYLSLNVLYSLWLKHIGIVDMFAVTLNYLLRLMTGIFIVHVSPTKWLLMSGTFAALLITMGKRRHELTLLGDGAEHHRGILKEYSPQLLDQMIVIVTAAILVVYSLYTFDPLVAKLLHTRYLPLTIPFVLYGLFRYLYLIHKKNSGGNPASDLLQDRAMLLNILLWGCVIVFLVYIVPRVQGSAVSQFFSFL